MSVSECGHTQPSSFLHSRGWQSFVSENGGGLQSFAVEDWSPLWWRIVVLRRKGLT